MLDTFCQGPQVDFYSSQQNFLRRGNLGMGFTSPWTQVTRPRGNKCVKITPRSYFQFSSRFATHTNQLTSEIFLQQISTAEQWGKVSRAEEKPWMGFTCTKVGTGGNSECQVHTAPGLQISILLSLVSYYYGSPVQSMTICSQIQKTHVSVSDWWLGIEYR